MDALKFTLGGRTAFFKQPDVNTYLYFSYGNIHKVALLGIFGAMLGYGGYNQQTNLKEKGEADQFPEFYQKLKDLQISIVPYRPSFQRKVQIFNNSVGYASAEQGGNLIVKEQWLEYPCWDIYVLLEGQEAENLERVLLERRFSFVPYLGKNDHPADIKDVEVCQLCQANQEVQVDSLFLKEECLLEHGLFEGNAFKYQEKLPTELEPITNKYVLKDYIHTNLPIRTIGHQKIYSDENKNIIFF